MMECDSKLNHMKTATVRDLRYRFPEIEARLREGEEIQISKRKRVIARLVPVRPGPTRAWPDFMARLKEIYGKKRLKVSGAELLAQERDRY
jgi:antitoxin (DNA-binding transcriptional repressor) of toxin-antitoxin stability system